ncbi:hypothetical protein FRC12_014207 [Ceratobasidium sp. 428]|nr:hypothetical protein FRC12_014207 [Ceratobasidium sp. 428]
MDADLQAVLWDQFKAMLSEAETSKSRPIAPINKLPPEILAMIFTLASNRCIMCDKANSRSQRVMPTIFSSVCSLWRQISLSTCALWSHLDISMEPFGYKQPYNRLKLWEARSQPAPLSIHISDEIPGLFTRILTEPAAMSITSFLAPYMARVSEVQVTSHADRFPNYMLDLLSHWAWKGTTEPARVLKIGGRGSSFEGIDLRARLSRAVQPVTINDFETFFQSLHTLYLYRVFIPWDSSVYHGLVDLYITAGAYSQHWFPTQSQLAGVLAACPKLCSLTLIDFTVRPDRGLVPNPVMLSHLETFSFLQPNSSDHNSIKRILSLIGSSSSSLKASLTLNTELACVAITRSFFARCNVTRLHLSLQNLPARCVLPFLAGHVPHLRMLALELLDFTDGTTQQRMATEINQTLDPWPQLQELCLIKCLLNSDHEQIRQLLQRHPIQKLYLSNCTRKYGTDSELRKEIEAVGYLAKCLGVLEVVATNSHVAGPSADD